MSELEFKMYDHVKDEGMKEYSPKPQYVITDQVFYCPLCDYVEHTTRFLKPYFWRKAVILHMLTKHNKKVVDEHY